MYRISINNFQEKHYGTNGAIENIDFNKELKKYMIRKDEQVIWKIKMNSIY